MLCWTSSIDDRLFSLFTGEKYALAKAMNVTKIVNHQWLVDWYVYILYSVLQIWSRNFHAKMAVGRVERRTEPTAAGFLWSGPSQAHSPSWRVRLGWKVQIRAHAHGLGRAIVHKPILLNLACFFMPCLVVLFPKKIGTGSAHGFVVVLGRTTSIFPSM